MQLLQNSSSRSSAAESSGCRRYQKIPSPVRRPSTQPPCKPGGPLREPGTAGAAEAGVVRVGAEASVHDQLAVGELGLVEAFWRNGRARKRVVRDSNLSRGAHRVDARVSVTRVGALI